MNSRRLIVLLYVVLIAGLGIGAGGLLIETRARHVQLKKIEGELRAQLADAQKRLADQQVTLERLKTDPVFVEKELRKRNFTKPGEMIFLFEN